MWRVLLTLMTVAGLWAVCTQPVDPHTEVDKAEKQWRTQGITSYHLEVRVVNSIWHVQSHQLNVRDSEVVDTTAYCYPTPTEGNQCEVEEFNAEDFTVEGLFSQARSQIQNQEERWRQIDFDPTYGFPNFIWFDDPDVYDDDGGWIVGTFQVLE
ncbi:MAG: DUF6174 domain-containing protein [Dehalococcoidia bacterium]